MVVEPFLKVIIPVGEVPTGAVSVAVNVMVTPVATGLAETVKAVAVVALLTVTDCGVEVLEAYWHRRYKRRRH